MGNMCTFGRARFGDPPKGAQTTRARAGRRPQTACPDCAHSNATKAPAKAPAETEPPPERAAKAFERTGLPSAPCTAAACLNTPRAARAFTAACRGAS